MSIFNKDQITTPVVIPPIDAATPTNLETATFALG